MAAEQNTDQLPFDAAPLMDAARQLERAARLLRTCAENTDLHDGCVSWLHESSANIDAARARIANALLQVNALLQAKPQRLDLRAF